MALLKKLLLLISFLTLAIALGVQLYARVRYNHQPSLEKNELETVIPKEYKGWTSQSIELTAWEREILSQDQYINRNYEKGSVLVNVYVAYWNPGSVPYYHAGAHNPDSCWVNSGMNRVDRKYSQPMSVSGQSLKPHEFGCYVAANGQPVDVVFWHLVGGRPMRYEDQKLGWKQGIQGRIDRFPMYIQDFKDYGLDQQQEQFFIRVYSNIPYSEWKDHPEINELFEILKPTGVFEAHSTNTNIH